MIKIQRYSITDILSASFSAIGKIWPQALISGAIFFLPFGLITIGLFQSIGPFFEAVIQSREGGFSPALLNQIIGFMGLYLLMPFLIVIGTSAQQAIILQSIENKRLNNEPRPLLSNITIFMRNFLRILSQYLIQSALLITFSLVFATIAILSLVPLITSNVSFFEQGANIILIVAFTIIFTFVLMIPTYWLTIKLFLAPYCAVRENNNPLLAMGQSIDLVRGHSWRVLGVYILTTLLVSFASSMVTTPVMLIGILPDYLRMISSISQGGLPQANDILHMYTNGSWGIGIAVWLQMIISTTIITILPVILHMDISVRKGLISPAPEEPLGNPNE